PPRCARRSRWLTVFFVLSCFRGFVSSWLQWPAMRKVFFALTLIAVPAVSLAQRGGGAGQPAGLSFRFVGPTVGNRVASVAGVPGDPYIYYAGAASGGIWKTTDGGIRWVPIADDMPVTAIG